MGEAKTDKKSERFWVSEFAGTLEQKSRVGIDICKDNRSVCVWDQSLILVTNLPYKKATAAWAKGDYSKYTEVEIRKMIAVKEVNADWEGRHAESYKRSVIESAIEMKVARYIYKKPKIVYVVKFPVGKDPIVYAFNKDGGIRNCTWRNPNISEEARKKLLEAIIKLKEMLREEVKHRDFTRIIRPAVADYLEEFKGNEFSLLSRFPERLRKTLSVNGSLRKEAKRLFGCKGKKTVRLLVEIIKDRFTEIPHMSTDLALLLKGIVDVDFIHHLIELALNSPCAHQQGIRHSRKFVVELKYIRSILTDANFRKLIALSIVPAGFYFTDSIRTIDIISRYRGISPEKARELINNAIRSGTSLRTIHDDLSRIHSKFRSSNISIEFKGNVKKIDGLEFDTKLGKIKFELPKDTDQIKKWGSIQGHCLGTYAEDCLMSGTSIIQVEVDEEVYHLMANSSGLEMQFYGKRNTPPRQEIREIVSEKLKESGCGIKLHDHKMFQQEAHLAI